MYTDYTKDNRSTKDEANYRDGNEYSCCKYCTMFRAPSSCTDVKGRISPDGICDYYKDKRYGG